VPQGQRGKRMIAMKLKACSLSISVLASLGTVLAFAVQAQLFAAGGGAAGPTGVGAVVPAGTPAVGAATSVGPAQISVGSPLNQPSGSFATGPVGAPATVPGMANQNGMGMQSGNPPIGSPLGNPQMQTQGNPNYRSLQSPGSMSPAIGGVNGKGAVVGGFQNQNTGFQGFRNGSPGTDGINNGGLPGGTANQEATPSFGVTGPNYFPNANAYNNNNNNNNNNANNNGSVPTNDAGMYGYNTTANNAGGYNAAPSIRLEQSAAEGHFQYGWW
jgi:hypothetical protein